MSVRKTLTVGTALVLAALGAWATIIEPDELLVQPTTIALADWPAGWRGLRVAAISDVHAGSFYVGYSKLEHMADLTNAAHPDLVVLLGDYVCHRRPHQDVERPDNLARVLARLRAPLGVVAVLGNHDNWMDGRRVRGAFESNGIRVLDNEVLRMERGGQPLWLAGIADAITGNPRVDATLARVPRGEAVVALTHNPDLFDHEIPDRVLLTLAGHTHGGQVRLPIVGCLIVPSAYGQRYAQGTVVEGRRTLFVTPGVGTSIAPIRFGVPPEISLLTVTDRQSQER
jgi:uncharacterized protein